MGDGFVGEPVVNLPRPEELMAEGYSSTGIPLNGARGAFGGLWVGGDAFVGYFVWIFGLGDKDFGMFQVPSDDNKKLSKTSKTYIFSICLPCEVHTDLHETKNDQMIGTMTSQMKKSQQLRQVAGPLSSARSWMASRDPRVASVSRWLVSRVTWTFTVRGCRFFLFGLFA